MKPYLGKYCHLAVCCSDLDLSELIYMKERELSLKAITWEYCDHHDLGRGVCNDSNCQFFFFSAPAD